MVKLRAAIKTPPRDRKMDTEDRAVTEGTETPVRKQGTCSGVVAEGFGDRLVGQGREGGNALTRVVAAGASSPRGLEANVEDEAKAGDAKTRVHKQRVCASASSQRVSVFLCCFRLFCFLCFFST